MIFNLIRKNILVQFNKTLIILLSLVVGSCIVFSFSAIYFDISAKMSKELRTYGANFFISSKNNEHAQINLQEYQKALKLIEEKNIVAQSPELLGLVRLDLANAILVGLDFANAKGLNPFWQINGKMISLPYDDRHCMVGASLAKQMELKLDSTVNILDEKTGNKISLKVYGIIESGTDADNEVFVNLFVAQKLFGKNDANYAKLSLSLDEAKINALSEKINASFGSLEAKPIRKISQSEGKILDKIKTLMALVAFMILSITTISVNTTLISSVHERGKQIALQKALGANDKSIIIQFLSENSIICVLSVFLGCIIGYFLAQFMAKAVFDSFVDIRFWVIPITFCISFVSTMIASFFPIKKALKIQPAILLKGD